MWCGVQNTLLTKPSSKETESLTTQHQKRQAPVSKVSLVRANKTDLSPCTLTSLYKGSGLQTSADLVQRFQTWPAPSATATDIVFPLRHTVQKHQVFITKSGRGINYSVSLQAPTAENTKTAVFWNAALIEDYQRFRGACCLLRHRRWVASRARGTGQTYTRLLHGHNILAIVILHGNNHSHTWGHKIMARGFSINKDLGTDSLDDGLASRRVINYNLLKRHAELLKMRLT
jgi:hypothetical protein